MSFWDASAIVPLCVKEPRSQLMWETLAVDTPMIVWCGSPVELAVAVTRQMRLQTLTVDEVQGALDACDALRETWIEIVSSHSIRYHAEHVARFHDLPPSAVLQLAAARTSIGPSRGREHTFVSLDPTLRRAAALEGFAALPRDPFDSSPRT